MVILGIVSAVSLLWRHWDIITELAAEVEAEEEAVWEAAPAAEPAREPLLSEVSHVSSSTAMQQQGLQPSGCQTMCSTGGGC